MQYLLVLALLAGQYEWRTFADEPNQLSLWHDGRQHGNLRIDTGEYFRHRDNGGFDEKASEPPFDPPAWARPKRCGCCKQCKCKADKCSCTPQTRCDAHCNCQKVIGGDPPSVDEKDGRKNYGISLEKMPDEPKHIVNGVEVSKDELIMAIGAPQLPNDASWLCVTVIGTQDMQKQVIADFATAPALAEWKNKIKLKTFDPTHWAVAGLGFLAPAIYFQAADGRVLWREDGYSGAEAMASDLRKIDPNYDPNRDPGPNQPTPDEGDGMSPIHLFAGIGTAVGGLGCMAFTLVAFALLLFLLWRRSHAAGS